MAAQKLTEKAIMAARPGKHVERLRDKTIRGFHLVVTPAGGKSWGLSYTSPESGKRRTVTLGHYPAMTLKEARQAATALRSKIDDARLDPVEEEQRREKEEQEARQVASATSVDALFRLYLEDMERDGKPSAYTARKLYEKDIQPAIGDLLARDITREHIADIIAAIADRGAQIQANRARSYMRAAFAFGLDVHTHPRWRKIAPDFKLLFNPVADVRRAVRNEPVGQRHLSKEEVRTLWRRMGVEAMAADLALAVKLLLATGQRVEEVLHAEWREFDLEEMLWIIPGDRRKTRGKTLEPHIVPLTAFHVDLLKELAEYSGHSRWLFPNSKDDGPRKNNALLQGVRRFCEPEGRSTRKPFERFTPRDLRRTWKTLAGSIGLPLELRNRIQGHALGDVGSRHYDRWDYLDEKRAGMRRWTDWLDELVNGKPAVTGASKLQLITGGRG